VQVQGRPSSAKQDADKGMEAGHSSPQALKPNPIRQFIGATQVAPFPVVLDLGFNLLSAVERLAFASAGRTLRVRSGKLNPLPTQTFRLRRMTVRAEAARLI
jgi:hypothetical protein